MSAKSIPRSVSTHSIQDVNPSKGDAVAWLLVIIDGWGLPVSIDFASSHG